MFHTPAHKQLDPSKQGAQRVNPIEGNGPVSPMLRALVAKQRAYDVVGQVMAYESGELDGDETTVLFQHLIDTGMAWQLQGSYGRQAMAMIRAGYCTVA